MADLQLSLIIDTAFDTCQVALAQDGEIIVALRAPSGGGHDRVLAGMVRDILSSRFPRAGGDPFVGQTTNNCQAEQWAPACAGDAVGVEKSVVLIKDQINFLSTIIVTTGPGRFTGLRVGIAFARGLSLVHKTPLTGVLTSDAMMVEMKQYHSGQKGRAILICVKRGESFVRFVDEGAQLHVIFDETLVSVLKAKGITLVGGILSPFAQETLPRQAIGISQNVMEPSLSAILAAAPDHQTEIVRPYYAASYVA